MARILFTKTTNLLELDNINIRSFDLSNDSEDQNFALLKLVLDASISGVILTDNRLPDNPIFYCNRSFEKLTGYHRSEIIGHNCRFLQKDERNQEERLIIKNAVKNGDSCVVEIRNYKKDGTLFYNELYISPVKDDRGEIIYFMGFQNDVSRRKKAETALAYQQELMEKRIEERTKSLKENENFLESIVQTVRESLIVLDPNLNVLRVNEHFIKTFKVTYEDTEGRQLFDLGNGQWNIPALKELLQSILPTNNPVEEFEVEHDFPYIGRKVMILNANRIELEGRYKDQILIAIEDFTDRREIERRKDDFLSVASHELKTPLTTIKGLVQVMQRMMPLETTEKFRSVLTKTALYVDRLNRLIEELLDVSRIQTGNIQLLKEIFDFDKMVEDVVESIQLSTKSHVIKVDGSSDAKVLADESHITQVVTNLLSNAIKYSPDGRNIVINIAKITNYVRLSVTDHGMGITFDDQKKIFDRFFRVGEIQQRFPGMGIGLYICDQIIRNHEGTLWVESEPGKGSTFSFTIPLS
jgi:PAS domain S-box-containing protein